MVFKLNPLLRFQVRRMTDASGADKRLPVQRTLVIEAMNMRCSPVSGPILINKKMLDLYSTNDPSSTGVLMCHKEATHPALT